MKYLLILLACLAVQSCETVKIDFFELGSFRVMAIVADQPEVLGTQDNTVTITPWISDIDAQGRIITLDILACPDPGIGLGEEPTCDAESPLTQSITYNDFDTNVLVAQNFTGAMPTFDVTIPSGLLDNVSQQNAFNGIDYVVSLVFDTGAESFNAFKRIKVSTRDSPNNNPEIEAILVNDSASAPLIDQAKVRYTLVSGAEPETYPFYNQDGTLQEDTENYLLTWFVYGGDLSLSRSEIDQEAVFTKDVDINNPFLVGVLRDRRGGLFVLVRQ